MDPEREASQLVAILNMIKTTTPTPPLPHIDKDNIPSSLFLLRTHITLERVGVAVVVVASVCYNKDTKERRNTTISPQLRQKASSSRSNSGILLAQQK
jgi:hypothetical protein